MSFRFLVFIFIMGFISSCQKPFSVAFYNVENLFDTLDNPTTIDEFFTPGSEIDWNTEKYTNKQNKLSEVIAKIGYGKAPTVLGVCEVENKKVLEDLITQDPLKNTKYQIVHFESPDARGIDNALLFSEKVFQLVKAENLKVDLSNLPLAEGQDPTYKQTTRDILSVQLKTKKNDTIQFYVCHFPSRRGGQEASEPKRLRAAETLMADKAKKVATNPNLKIIIMGDFNDEPENASIQGILMGRPFPEIQSFELYNPMFLMAQDSTLGSYCYRGDWNVLDQFLISKSLLNAKKGVKYVPNSAQIVNEDWLRQHGNHPYDGYPNRTLAGKKYLGGYSDHFPIRLKLNTK